MTLLYCVPNQYVNMNMLVVDTAHMLGLAAGNKGEGYQELKVRGGGGGGETKPRKGGLDEKGVIIDG